MRQVAFLRGINVGGKNCVAMRDLAKLFEGAGCQNVQTYIQSGNVIFDAKVSSRGLLARQLAEAIQLQFGLKVPLVLRSLDEIKAVLANNPFLLPRRPDTTEDMLHVYFLAERPNAERAAQLDPARSLPDAFVLQGSEIYLLLPKGMARTKLTNAYFDAALSTVCTARNWRTISKVCDLMSGPSR